MKNTYNILINGRLIQALSGETTEVINPANGRVIDTVPKCGTEELEMAVEAATNAAQGWASKSVAERAKIFFKLAELIRENHDELTGIETMQYGGPVFKTGNFDIPFSSEMLEYMAGIGRAVAGMTLPVNPSCMSMTVREPMGVVGLITPWNFPLVTVLAKVAPALIVGNTAVVKPPSCAPLTALKLGELSIEAGMPAGVLNIVTGPGPVVGEALVKHPVVAKIGFTGDSETGKRIMSLCSTHVKPLACELGGKNAFIVLKDADMDAAIEGAVWGSFFNSGQNCGSPSRFIIHESIYDEFAEKFVQAAGKLRVGDPMKKETMMGPLAYKGHRDVVESFIEDGKKSGAKLLLGGNRPDTPETRDGCFVNPTIFADCDTKMNFMQEEIFGPVVGLMRFNTPEEAVKLANDTRYGLCASIWTKDIRTGLTMTNQIKVGTVWLNQHLSIVFEIPWGGCKESGFGKENSIMALDEFTMIKHVWIDLAGTPSTPWQGQL